MTAHIRRLYDHMVWADARTLNSLRSMHAAPLDALRLYGHLLAAEHVWLTRMEGREPEIPVWPALDLDECAATGTTADLIYVSPKTGRAVSRAAGEAFHDRLLPLPAFLVQAGLSPNAAETADAFRLTGAARDLQEVEADLGSLPT